MGIRKMKEAMVAAGLREPTFKPDGFFRAIFRRSPKYALKEGAPGPEKRVGEKVGDRVAETARASDRTSALKVALKTSVKSALKTASAIMAAMEQDPKITVPDIAKAISVSARTVNNHIGRLKEAGFIRRVGPDKGGHWEVVE